MNDERDPLPSDARAALDRARGEPVMPDATRAALRARLGRTLGVPMGPPPSGAPPANGAPASPRTLAAHAPRLARSLGTARWLAVTAGVGLSTFALGVGVGARLGAPVARIVPAVEHAPQPRPTPAPLPREAPVVVAQVAHDAVTPPIAHAAHDAGVGPVAARDPDAMLRRQRQRIDAARVALLRGEPDAALAGIGRDEREAPEGQLAPERELLAVQALVAAHRFDEARARAARFHQRYRGNLLGPVVDAALGSIP